MIKKFLAAYTVHICRSITGRYTKRKFMSFQKFHCMHNFLIYTFSTTSVVCFLRTFQADCRNKVLNTKHFLAEFFVDQCTICKGKELAVRIFLADTHQVFLTYQRFTTCIYVHISSHFSALLYNRTDGIKIKIQFVTILCCPASCAVQITGTCRIKKDCPWNIAVVLFCCFFLKCTSF